MSNKMCRNCKHSSNTAKGKDVLACIKLHSGEIRPEEIEGGKR